MAGPVGIGAEYIQVKKDDWEELNRAFRQCWNRLDALEGRRGIVALGNNVNLNTNKVLNSADPEDPTDLVTLQYAEGNFGAAALAQALSIAGSNPLNISQLRGIAAQPQPASIPVVTALPPVTDSINGELAIFNNIVYYFDNSSSPGTWIPLKTQGVAIVDTFGNIPAVGTVPTGTIYFTVDTVTTYINNGTNWITAGGLYQVITNSVNNAVTTIHILQHLVSSGSGAAGMGVELLAQMPDTAAAAGAYEDAGSMQWVWTVATSGSENSKCLVKLRYAGAALAEFFRILTTGISFNVGGFYGNLIHANSVDRTYTFPNDDGTMVYDKTALTANNIIIGVGTSRVAPLGSLGSVTTVLHGNAGGAPSFSAVDLANDITGTLTAANGGTGFTDFFATIDRTGQTADITTTALTGSGGHYMLQYYIEITTGDALAGIVTLTIGYTDDIGATSQTAALALTATARSTGVLSIARVSGNITYATTHTGIFGSSVYTLRMSLVRLS